MESGPSSVIGVSPVHQAKSRDPLLARVVEFVQRGWPMNCPNEDIRQYFIHRDELTIKDGVLLWGLRVVLPPPLQSEVLALLHELHPGCTRCKQLARSYVLWPGIDADIERVVQSCLSYAEQRQKPTLLCWGVGNTHRRRFIVFTSTTLGRFSVTTGSCGSTRTPSMPASIALQGPTQNIR